MRRAASFSSGATTSASRAASVLPSRSQRFAYSRDHSAKAFASSLPGKLPSAPAMRHSCARPQALPQSAAACGTASSAPPHALARIAAKIPARRLPETVSRLIALYQGDRSPDEEAAAFFRRVSPERVKALLADLEALPLEDALPEDFVDLAESTEFKVEILDGECSA